MCICSGNTLKAEGSDVSIRECEDRWQQIYNSKWQRSGANGEHVSQGDVAIGCRHKAVTLYSRFFPCDQAGLPVEPPLEECERRSALFRNLANKYGSEVTASSARKKVSLDSD